jgi:DNA-binding MarR family transcriptional regulator
MKEITRLVNEWDAFESKHPDAVIEDFCRYYLLKKKETEDKTALFGGHMPPEIHGILGKLIVRLAAIHSYYFKNTKKGIRELDLDSFALLNSVHHRKEAKKTDPINEYFMEISTGLDIFARLKKKGLISERQDTSDKRAKLVRLTAKGEKVLLACWNDLGKISRFMYGDMDMDDKKIIFHLLSTVDIKHSKIISENKSQDIGAVIHKNKKQA